MGAIDLLLLLPYKYPSHSLDVDPSDPSEAERVHVHTSLLTQLVKYTSTRSVTAGRLADSGTCK